MTEPDIIEQWKGEVAKLRMEYDARLAAEVLRLKRKHQREMDEATGRTGDYRNWRGE